jgi:chromosome segregation ATPase
MEVQKGKDAKYQQLNTMFEEVAAVAARLEEEQKLWAKKDTEMGEMVGKLDASERRKGELERDIAELQTTVKERGDDLIRVKERMEKHAKEIEDRLMLELKNRYGIVASGR